MRKLKELDQFHLWTTISYYQKTLPSDYTTTPASVKFGIG